MKLTIGMASYKNFNEVRFTIQALRMYQDLTDTEILIVDNYGDDNINSWVINWGCGAVRYVRHTEAKGTAAAKEKVFSEAKGDWVICIDSHVFLVQGAVARFKQWADENPDCLDLLHGPLLYDNLISGADSFNDVWSSGMWGQWNNLHEDRTLPPYEIPMMGMGLFGCRKDAWLGFNPEFRGFGGEEGYIHAKYKKAGRKTLCLPWLQWNHFFRDKQTPIPYPLRDFDKCRNYVLGHIELGLDLSPVIKEFGKAQVDRVLKGEKENEDMKAIWTCPSCNLQQPVTFNPASKTGMVLKCSCGKESAVNFKVTVDADAALVAG